MMSQTLSVSDASMNNYVLSITTRDNGDTPEIIEELTYRTIKMWLWIAGNLEQHVYKLSPNSGSVESRYAAELNAAYKDTDAPPKEPFVFNETFGDARVTVWDTYRGAKHPQFHLNSDDDLQTAVNTWLANQNAVQRAYNELAPPQQKVAESRQDGATNVSQPNFNTDKMATPKTPVNAIIVATRAPSPTTPQYADGQQVSFQINKIVAGSNKGSATYALWGSLGTKYPLVTVYKCKTNSTDLNPNYIKIAPTIEKLGLSLDKPEVSGNWFLVCHSAHSNGKEYMNCELLETVTG